MMFLTRPAIDRVAMSQATRAHPPASVASRSGRLLALGDPPAAGADREDDGCGEACGHCRGRAQALCASVAGCGGWPPELVEIQQNVWPAVSFRWVPPLAEAVELAAHVREQVCGLKPHEPVSDLSLLLTAGQFDLSETDLGVHRGGHEALMFPGADGRLQIRVDPRPKDQWGTSSRQLRDQTRRHRLRFRVAHEVAHLSLIHI